MKKSILITMCMAGMAMAGEPAEPIAVTPIQAPPVAPVADCPLSLEVAGVYRFASRYIMSDDFVYGKKIDTYGGDLTLVYGLNDNWSANLRIGYTFGDEVDRDYGCRQEVDLHTFTIMPGLRYTTPLNDTWSVYGGVNMGVANESVKYRMYAPLDKWTEKFHDSEWNFAVSAEVGLRYKVSENTEIFAAYEFYGSVATPLLGDEWTRLDTHRQTYHGIRTGVSIKF